VLAGLIAPSAHASSLTSLRAEAQTLASRIQSLGTREDALAEQYDGARLTLQRTEQQLTAARRQVAQASAAAAKARSVLQSEAVNAYVNAGSTLPATPSQASANDNLLRTEYEQSLASNQTNAEDQYHTASLRAATAEAQLRHEESVARANLASIASARSQVESTQAQLEGAYHQDQGRIATLIAQEEAARQAAEQRVAERRLAAERAAAAQQAAAARATASRAAAATTTTTAGPVQSPPPTSSGGGGGFTPPPSSSAAEIAVKAAESRVGDPYVWGASGPNAFDCSGLVMWAYEQAGIQLPHFSGAQYADTVHIPMSDLQPGDLVFFSNPDEHVAMYVGNGDVVQAPYTGADVQIVPLYPELTLAGRVE